MALWVVTKVRTHPSPHVPGTQRQGAGMQVETG